MFILFALQKVRILITEKQQVFKDEFKIQICLFDQAFGLIFIKQCMRVSLLHC